MNTKPINWTKLEKTLGAKLLPFQRTIVAAMVEGKIAINNIRAGVTQMGRAYEILSKGKK